jgi:hypothetical protein
MKNILFGTLICLITISITSCKSDPFKVAMETGNTNKGLKALNKINNQDQLKEIALHANNPTVCDSAFPKLNQDILTEIAMKDEYIGNRKQAVFYIEDPKLLVKFALNDTTVCEEALKKMAETSVFLKMSYDKNDRQMQLISKFIQSSYSVPQEHMARLMKRLIPTIHVFLDPRFIKIVGEVDSFETQWYSTKEDYYKSFNYTPTSEYVGFLKGEDFSFQVKFQKKDKKISEAWSTKFPYSTTYYNVFCPAEISGGDIFNQVFSELSQPLLEEYARDSDTYIRRVAVYNLTNQKLLGKIAIEDKSYEIRKAALEKLDNQQNIYEKLALEDSNLNIRKAAIEKLTSVKVLEEIMKENDNEIKSTAQYRLNELKRKEKL